MKKNTSSMSVFSCLLPKHRVLLALFTFCLIIEKPILTKGQPVYRSEQMGFASVTAVNVEVETQSGYQGIGSGMYFSDLDYTYFLTARHVLFKENSAEPKVVEVRLTSYATDAVTDKPVNLGVNIVSAMFSNCVQMSATRDMVIIRLFKKEPSNKSNLNQWFKQVPLDFVKNQTPLPTSRGITAPLMNSAPIDFFCKYEYVNLGDEIYIYGYPSSIGLEESPQYDYKRPLLKRGRVAGKYNQRKTIILDCFVFHGNSGGPAILMSERFNTLKVAGIVLQYIPYKETILEFDSLKNDYAKQNRTLLFTNSGYSVIEPIDEVFILINDLKKLNNEPITAFTAFRQNYTPPTKKVIKRRK